MSNTNQDQSQQPQNSNEDPPEGYYEAVAVGETEPHVIYGESEKGFEQIGIEMKLLDLNRTGFVVLHFSDAAAPFSLERLKALGWKGGNDMAGITTNKVTVRAKRDYWVDSNGQQKNAMKYEIMTGNRFAFAKPLDDQKKRGFFAKLNQLANQEAPKTAAQGGGYPKDWHNPGPATSAGGAGAKPPRVDLG